MTNEEIIEKYLKREMVIKNISSYIAYYQISLGHNVLELLQDNEAAIKKLTSLNLALKPNEVFITIFTIIITNSHKDNFSSELAKYIREEAFLHSLEDLVNNDDEILNKERYTNIKKQHILDGTFFTTELKMRYMQEFPIMYKYYEPYMTDDYIEATKKIFIKNFLT